jgi:Flp pilus assembly protein TadG
VRRSRLNRTRAQSTVEFALMLPCFLALIIGIFDVGITYQRKVTLSQATRDGARKAAIARTFGSAAVVTRGEAAVRDTAGHLDQSKLTVAITSNDNPDAPDGTTWEQGDEVVVRTTYPWSISIFGASVMSGTLIESTTLRME